MIRQPQKTEGAYTKCSDRQNLVKRDSYKNNFTEFQFVAKTLALPRKILSSTKVSWRKMGRILNLELL